MRVGTVHDGDVAVCNTFLFVDLRDFVGDPSCFLLCVVGRVSDDLVAFAKCRPQFFRLAIFISCNHRIGGVENGLRRTIILFEHDGFRVREILLEILNIANVRTSERVNRLVGIAYHRNPRWSDTARATHMLIGLFSRVNAGKLAYEHILRMVGVLILVHENITELMPIVFAYLWATLEQFDGAHDQIVKIHGIRHGQTALVLRIHHGDQLIDVAGRNLISALAWLVVAVHAFQLVLP